MKNKIKVILLSRVSDADLDKEIKGRTRDILDPRVVYYLRLNQNGTIYRPKNVMLYGFREVINNPSDFEIVLEYKTR